MIKHQLQVNLHLLIEIIQVIILKRLQIIIKTEKSSANKYKIVQLMSKK